MDTPLNEMLQRAASGHHHLCPRQVLGVRMGVLAGKLLSLSLPQQDKRLIVISETDGCAVDGLIAATGCTVGHRTLRIEDYGKVAATFVDSIVGKGIRIVPRPSARGRAREFAPSGCSRWEAYVFGYQEMPDDVLFRVEDVMLRDSIERIVSKAGRRTVCQSCGEEINNEREVKIGQWTLCKSCSGESYYFLPEMESHHST